MIAVFGAEARFSKPPPTSVRLQRFKQPLRPGGPRQHKRATTASMTVIPLVPLVPFHLFGKLKSSTSALMRSFWRLGGNRLVLVSSAIPWRLAQNSSEITSGFELFP
jgi:hypothetical protein